MKIKEMLDSGSRITISVTPADLKEFALTIAEEVKAAMRRDADAEERLSLQETAKILHVSASTLWRWERIGYLKPAGHIGRKPYYTRGQLNGLERN